MHVTHDSHKLKTELHLSFSIESQKSSDVAEYLQLLEMVIRHDFQRPEHHNQRRIASSFPNKTKRRRMLTGICAFQH